MAFLEAARRDDGIWPIDVNLATWLTTLSVNAMGAGGDGWSERLAGADPLPVVRRRARSVLRTIDGLAGAPAASRTETVR